MDDDKKIDRRGFISQLLLGIPLSSVLLKWGRFPWRKKDGGYIYLYEDRVAGFFYHKGFKHFSRLRVGDELILKKEPDNSFDERAVEIYHRKTGMKLGYISRELNRVIFQLMENGSEFRVVISALEDDELYNYRDVYYRIWLEKESV
jgi:hypothetical protein